VAIAGLARDFRNQQNFSGPVALPGSEREHARQLQLVQAGLGVQPNRTPSAGLRGRLNNPIPGSPGAAGAAGPNPLSFNPPPTLKKKRAGANLQSFLG
jgi:hypothetical protein